MFILSLEKREIFSIDDLKVTHKAYDFFRSQFKQTFDLPPFIISEKNCCEREVGLCGYLLPSGELIPYSCHHYNRHSSTIEVWLIF